MPVDVYGFLAGLMLCFFIGLVALTACTFLQTGAFLTSLVVLTGFGGLVFSVLMGHVVQELKPARRAK